MAYIGKTPTAAALTASDITDGIVSNAKLAQDIISADTALGAEPADTDEFLVSDAGVLKRMDYSYIKGTLTSATAVTLSDQSEVDFTSIPSGVKHIKLILSEISNNSTAEDLIAQIGDSGGVETSA